MEALLLLFASLVSRGQKRDSEQNTEYKHRRKLRLSHGERGEGLSTPEYCAASRCLGAAAPPWAARTVQKRLQRVSVHIWRRKKLQNLASDVPFTCVEQTTRT